jgi:hypothetical protein
MESTVRALYRIGSLSSIFATVNILLESIMNVRFRSVLIALGAAASFNLYAGQSAQGQASSKPVKKEVSPSIAIKEKSSFVDDPFYTTNRIDWPSPGRYRSADGRPGPEYWQQRADYSISVTLDTASKSLFGIVQMQYTNNSPDTLTYLWMQLDQNLYQPNSRGSAIFSADSRWGGRGFQGGYELSDVRVDGKPVQYVIDDTRMRIDLSKPLLPRGRRIMVTMRYAFRVPEHGSDRMGRDGTLYQIAQWYPRVAVYDDVRGWNTEPYLGQGEFYLEYGDFDYSITVPAGYVVAATGVLQNPKDVLTQTQRARLATASKTTSVVQIITAEEARAGLTPKPGTKTWRFQAKNVRDVAWAAAPDFRWDATSWNGILCQAFYSLDKTGIAWETAAEQTQFSIRLYSELFFPYPYPQATTVAGPVGGMEYPMFVMVHAGRNRPDDPHAIFGTLDHEHGHEWFPMIVGSNERRYAWFDEGLNTYINTFALERRFLGKPNGTVYPMYLNNWKTIRERGIDVPLMTAPDHVPAPALGAIGYRKPAALLLTLRNHVVGKEAFDAAFRAYIQAWAFKHPTPADFFRMIENYAGADLSWYWRNFWYTTSVLDIGVENVSIKRNGDMMQSTIVLKNVTKVPFPVTMRVKYASGKVQDIKLPVDIWAQGDTFEAVVIDPEGVSGVRLWPDPTVPDWDEKNNTWGDAPEGEPLKPLTM